MDDDRFANDVQVGAGVHVPKVRRQLNAAHAICANGEIPEHTVSIQQFVGPEGRFSGTLDLAAFYDWLVDEGHVDPSYYATAIEFGNEVIEGSGERHGWTNMK